MAVDRQLVSTSSNPTLGQLMVPADAPIGDIVGGDQPYVYHYEAPVSGSGGCQPMPGNEPDSSRDGAGVFTQEVGIGTIGTINDTGIRVESVTWNELTPEACASGGVVKVRRGNGTGLGGVPLIDIVIECGNSRSFMQLNGIVEGYNVVIPPR